MIELQPVELEEVDQQVYDGNGCVFSSGLAFGAEPDVIYFRWGRPGDGPHTLLLRPDEAARIAALLSNAVYSWEMKALLDASDAAEAAKS